VKGAAGFVVFACFFELYARINHVNDIDAVEQVINKSLWY
jgi:hypothetical protein